MPKLSLSWSWPWARERGDESASDDDRSSEAVVEREPTITPAPEVTRDKQFELVMHDLDRRLAGQDRRMTSAESRSNTLIASSAIFAGLLVATPMSYEVLVALVVNIAAAGFGIATIFPRAMPDLDPAGIRLEVLRRGPSDASLYLVDQYLVLIEDREGWIELRMRLVRAGLGLLVGSLILAAMAISNNL